MDCSPSDVLIRISVCLMFLCSFSQDCDTKTPFRPQGKPTDVWLCLWLVVRLKQTTCLFYAFPLSVSRMEGAQTSLLAYAHILRWQEQL